LTATTQTMRGAARSTTMRRLARLGLAARGAIYLLVGVLAVLVALGKKNSETDQRGALQETTQHTGGTFLVWVIAIGLACYALWRFSEAAFGVVGEGNKAGPRLQSFVRGCIYAFLAFGAFKLLLNRGSSQARQQETITAKVMQHNGGRWVVGVVGAVIVVVGLVLVWQGLRHHFEKYLDLGAMSYETHRMVRLIGMIGTVARGVVFALAGIFVVQAARDYDPKKASGLDGALRSLRDTSAGPWLLILAAVGLILFGVYGFAEARWRRT
jgi:Domain of Unknown Function (DUF1206)